MEDAYTASLYDAAMDKELHRWREVTVSLFDGWVVSGDTLHSLALAPIVLSESRGMHLNAQLVPCVVCYFGRVIHMAAVWYELWPTNLCES